MDTSIKDISIKDLKKNSYYHLKINLIVFSKDGAWVHSEFGCLSDFNLDGYWLVFLVLTFLFSKIFQKQCCIFHSAHIPRHITSTK